MKCNKCIHIIKNSEHYIQLNDGTILCEECYLEYSLKELNAELRQNVIRS